jgi:hypothetical protein
MQVPIGRAQCLFLFIADEAVGDLLEQIERLDRERNEFWLCLIKIALVSDTLSG